MQTSIRQMPTVFDLERASSKPMHPLYYTYSDDDHSETYERANQLTTTRAFGALNQYTCAFDETIVGYQSFNLISTAELNQRILNIFQILTDNISKLDWARIRHFSAPEVQGTQKLVVYSKIPSWQSEWHKNVDSIILRLGKLTDGWAGEDTRAPTSKIIDIAQNLLNLLPATTQLPEVEVDEEFGSINFSWSNSEYSQTFSLSIPNEKTVIGVVSCLSQRYPESWKFSANDDMKMKEMLESSPIIRRLLAGN